MISSKVNAIVMAACDENALIGVVQKAIDGGIPVVTIDSGIKSDIAVSFVATDNVAAGRTAAKELARLVGEAGGEVGLIPFVPGAATSEQREKGFIEGLGDFPKLKLGPKLYSMSDVSKGMSVTEDMLTSTPGLKGIFNANEPGAVGSAQAIKAAGKAGQVKLVAFDAADEEIAALKDGSVQALIVQDPFKMGYQGVKAAINHLQGKPVEKRIVTDVTVVTMENFANPEIQKLLYPLAK
jgi:ribose transport system substrate-binding protein